MDRKFSAETNNSHERSSLHEAGSARRRLVRALGGSSGLALAGLIAGGWKKPVVDATLLPAHADSSGSSDTGTPSPCTVYATEVGSVPIASYVLAIAFGAITDIVASTTGVNGQAQVTASTVISAANSPLLAWGLITADATNLAGTGGHTVYVSCCTNSNFLTGTVSSDANDDALGIQASFVDEGQCTLLLN